MLATISEVKSVVKQAEAHHMVFETHAQTSPKKQTQDDIM